MNAKFRPTLTPEQYRERSKLLRVEVANVAWSLVVSPRDAGLSRQWRALTPEQTLDVFDRLMRAVGRHATLDDVRLGGAP